MLPGNFLHYGVLILQSKRPFATRGYKGQSVRRRSTHDRGSFQYFRKQGRVALDVGSERGSLYEYNTNMNFLRTFDKKNAMINLLNLALT